MQFLSHLIVILFITTFLVGIHFFSDSCFRSKEFKKNLRCQCNNKHAKQSKHNFDKHLPQKIKRQSFHVKKNYCKIPYFNFDNQIICTYSIKKHILYFVYTISKVETSCLSGLARPSNFLNLAC